MCILKRARSSFLRRTPRLGASIKAEATPVAIPNGTTTANSTPTADEGESFGCAHPVVSPCCVATATTFRGIASRTAAMSCGSPESARTAAHGGAALGKSIAHRMERLAPASLPTDETLPAPTPKIAASAPRTACSTAVAFTRPPSDDHDTRSRDDTRAPPSEEDRATPSDEDGRGATAGGDGERVESDEELPCALPAGLGLALSTGGGIAGRAGGRLDGGSGGGPAPRDGPAASYEGDGCAASPGGGIPEKSDEELPCALAPGGSCVPPPQSEMLPVQPDGETATSIAPHPLIVI